MLGMNNFIKWHPLESISKNLYVKSLYDDSEGFRILLEGDGNLKILLSFENYYGYRNFNESERLKTWNQYSSLASNWSLYTAKNTAFTKWLSDESLGIVEENDITHYLITTEDDVIEILSSDPPTVKYSVCKSNKFLKASKVI